MNAQEINELAKYIWKAVRIKHEYNKTRQYRHGGDGKMRN